VIPHTLYFSKTMVRLIWFGRIGTRKISKSQQTGHIKCLNQRSRTEDTTMIYGLSWYAI